MELSCCKPVTRTTVLCEASCCVSGGGSLGGGGGGVACSGGVSVGGSGTSSLASWCLGASASCNSPPLALQLSSSPPLAFPSPVLPPLPPAIKCGKAPSPSCVASLGELLASRTASFKSSSLGVCSALCTFRGVLTERGELSVSRGSAAVSCPLLRDLSLILRLLLPLFC